MIGVLLAVIVLAVLVVFHDVLLVAFGGVLVAIVLDGFVRVIRSRISMPRWSALLLSIFIPGIFIVMGLVYGGAIVVRQYAALQTAIPIALQAGYHNLQAGPLAGLLPTTALDLQPLVGSAIGFAQRATGLISSGVGLLIGFGIMLFVGACIAAEPTLYRDGIVLIVPPRHRRTANALLDEMGRTLAAWLSARLVSMFAIAVLAAVGLSVRHRTRHPRRCARVHSQCRRVRSGRTRGDSGPCN
jgi:predicted PurR-regulated permease PerM